MGAAAPPLCLLSSRVEPGLSCSGAADSCWAGAPLVGMLAPPPSLRLLAACPATTPPLLPGPALCARPGAAPHPSAAPAAGATSRLSRRQTRMPGPSTTARRSRSTAASGASTTSSMRAGRGTAAAARTTLGRTSRGEPLQPLLHLAPLLCVPAIPPTSSLWSRRPALRCTLRRCSAAHPCPCCCCWEAALCLHVPANARCRFRT